MFFVFCVKSPSENTFKNYLTSVIKNFLSAETRVAYVDSYSFKDKVQIVRDNVFNFVIPYLLFLFTPIKFFKKNGNTFDFHYLLNDNNDYFEFNFIEVNNGIFFQKDGNRINANVHPELFLRYQNLIEYFSKNNIFALIFISWYCTVMSDEDKKKYIGDGPFLNHILKYFSKDVKNFNSLISFVEGEHTKMSEQNIFNRIKQFFKIFVYLNVNVILSPSPTNNKDQVKGDKDQVKGEKNQDGENQTNNSCVIDNNDKQLIDLLFKKLGETFTEPVLKAFKEEFSKSKEWISFDLKFKKFVDDWILFFEENKDQIHNGLINLRKTNNFLENFRMKIVFFYCFYNYNQNIIFNWSAGLDFSPKKSQMTGLIGVGVDIENLPILTNFYIDSVSLLILTYEFDLSKKDFFFNGFSCLVFPSFFCLKNFKLFVGVRFHENIAFSIGASYIRKKKSL